MESYLGIVPSLKVLHNPIFRGDLFILDVWHFHSLGAVLRHHHTALWAHQGQLAGEEHHGCADAQAQRQGGGHGPHRVAADGFGRGTPGLHVLQQFGVNVV